MDGTTHPRKPSAKTLPIGATDMTTQTRTPSAQQEANEIIDDLQVAYDAIANVSGSALLSGEVPHEQLVEQAGLVHKNACEALCAVGSALHQLKNAAPPVPVAWEYRCFDRHRVVSGEVSPGWDKWKRVELRNPHIDTIYSRVREIQDYIGAGHRYELRALYTAPPHADPHTVRDAALEALESAQGFIKNGIEFGYIRMPDADTPDPALRTPRLIDAAIRALKHTASATAVDDVRDAIPKEALFLQEQDQCDLHCFIETTGDDEGYDIGKDTISRLAELGVVRNCGFGRYSVTAFGYWAHERYWEQRPSLPLETNIDRDAKQRAALQSNQEER